MLQKIENGGRFPWQHVLVGRTARYHVQVVSDTLRTTDPHAKVRRLRTSF